MPNWEGSNRRSRLPSDWEKRRKEQLRKDGYQCREILPDGTRCTERATEVDHIEAKADDHSSLQSLCKAHHATKSGREGQAARRKLLAASSKKFLRTESHPGLL